MDNFGFIHDKLDIKILILFVLRRLPGAVDPETLHSDYYAPMFGSKTNAYGGAYCFKVQTYISADDPKSILEIK